MTEGQGGGSGKPLERWVGLRFYPGQIHVQHLPTQFFHRQPSLIFPQSLWKKKWRRFLHVGSHSWQQVNQFGECWARAGRPSFKGPFDYEVYWGLVTLPQPNPPQRAVVGAQGDVSHPELLAGLVGCKHNNNGRNVRREYPTALSWRQAQLERTVLPSAMVAP